MPKFADDHFKMFAIYECFWKIEESEMEAGVHNNCFLLNKINLSKKSPKI